MGTGNVTVVLQLAFLVSYLVLRVARIEGLCSLKLLGLRDVCEDLIMDLVTRNRRLRLRSIDIAYVVAVAHHALFLLLRLGTIDIVVSHLVSNESRNLGRYVLDRLELVSWVQRVARWPVGLELLAVWLGAFDVFVSEVCLRFVQLEVEFATLGTLDV